ncbi:hypothetical protein BH10PSE10_BH10PSE10_26580 [soil metagenome]
MKISTKTFVLAASAAVSMFAAVAAAQAGQTISDQHYWPNEIHSSRTSGSVFDALASMDDSTAAPAANPVVYRGGPKTGTRS